LNNPAESVATDEPWREEPFWDSPVIIIKKNRNENTYTRIKIIVPK
jgi:hypothetical protein